MLLLCVAGVGVVVVIIVVVIIYFCCMNAPGLSQEVLALQRCLLLCSSFAGLAGKPAKATCDEEAPAERTQLMRRGQGPPVLTYSRLPSKLSCCCVVFFVFCV